MIAALKQDDFYQRDKSAAEFPPLREVKRTYADYLSWEGEKEGEKFEVIDGRVYMMASPSTWHQWVAGKIYRQIDEYLDGKKRKVFYDLDPRPAPKPDNSDETVVRPDIVVVCEPDKITKGGITGVPAMIVEVLSPSNANHDKVRKLRKYQEAGVREYWIADPETLTVDVNILENGKYNLTRYCVNRPDEVKADGGIDGPTKIPVSVLADCVKGVSEPCRATFRLFCLKF